MHFLCDAIDLKLSVEGTLNVFEKSLKIVLDEVHFLVNLYSFRTQGPQSNSSFTKVSHLPPSQAEQLPKLPPPLDTLTIALVCFFSSNLSHS